MNARNPRESGWFVGIDPGDIEGAAERIEHRQAAEPGDWPGLAVGAGFVENRERYYDQLREATIHAARAEVTRRESADDRQLAHAIRELGGIGRKLT